VAVRTAYRPVPQVRLFPRLARGFVYVLVVVAFTVTAAYGGYTIGHRSRPDDAAIRTDESAAVSTAVHKAVRHQAAIDRAKRRDALRAFADFQRTRFASELQRKLDEQHIVDAQAAARAYSRGRKAGVITATEKAAKDAKDGAPATAKPEHP
jgi:hypothetical protein